MSRKEKVACIVQARMGSTRLPGKVLALIQGKPVLWHIVKRLRYSKIIDEIVIATTINIKDAAIESFCKRYKVGYFRGAENDVLDRYYQAAKLHNASVIVRITADCPLIDPGVVDKVIRYYLGRRDRIDYVSNTLIRSFPQGLDTEVFTFRALEKSWQKAKKAYQREHVTPYIYEHPEIFRTANLKNNKDFSYLRWTVDEPKDLELVRQIYRRLYREGNIFIMNKILAVLRKEPELLEINKGIKQRNIKTEARCEDILSIVKDV